MAAVILNYNLKNKQIDLIGSFFDNDNDDTDNYNNCFRIISGNKRLSIVCFFVCLLFFSHLKMKGKLIVKLLSAPFFS